MPTSVVSMNAQGNAKVLRAESRLQGLSDEVEALKALLAEKNATIEALQQRIEALCQIAFVKKSERRQPSHLLPDGQVQGHLFHTELLADAERTAVDKKVQGELLLEAPRESAPRKGRRSTLPDHLPRVTTAYELKSGDCVCERCGGSLHQVGKETTRELERLETAVLHEIRRAKYACRGCGEGVKTAPGPDRAIEKGLLGPGYLAHVAVKRFGNHLPDNRLEKKYAAEGLSLSRSVLERSMKTLAEILAPVRTQMRLEILSQPELFTDDTPVTLAWPKDGGGPKKGRVWIYLDREGRHFCDFTDSRKRDGPLSILGGYCGAIHADAYPGYDRLFLPEGAVEVACWAHVRRKFIDAEKSEPDLAKQAVDLIRDLYAIERSAKCLSDAMCCALPQQHSVPIVS